MTKTMQHIIYLFVLILNVIPSLGQNTDFKLLTERDTFVADERILLKFNWTLTNETPTIHLHSSFGSIVLEPELKSEQVLEYRIPEFISRKAGQIVWYFIRGNKAEKRGVITVLPVQKAAEIETYMGPPDIMAGGEDFTMFVSVPTDQFDNTMLDSTIVNLEYYFKDRSYNRVLRTEKGFVFKRIFSPNKSGRIFAVSECLDKYSKEYDVNVQPALPIDFLIFTDGHHYYADGNQISQFKTSVLVDSFDNVIRDGTMVEFYIKNKYGNILKTRGVTIDGVAIADMIHPEFEDHWQVQAIVSGMAESNVIHVDFEQVVESFEVQFYDENRKIVLGPVKSYMNQLIPDGFKADMMIYKDNKPFKREIKEFKDGLVTYMLDINEIESGYYKLVFKVAEINQTFEKIELK